MDAEGSCERCGESPAWYYKRPGWEIARRLCQDCIKTVRVRSLGRLL